MSLKGTTFNSVESIPTEKVKMAQTLISSYIHIVFSTKNRFGFIMPEIEAELYSYIGGVLRKYDCKLLAAGDTSNHIHLLISLSKNHLIPDLVGAIKRSSSKWLKTKGGMLSKFTWQDGYSAFSVGYTQIQAVEKYIANQKEHHRKEMFEDEMREFYRKYRIEFDEQYVWVLQCSWSLTRTAVFYQPYRLDAPDDPSPAMFCPCRGRMRAFSFVPFRDKYVVNLVSSGFTRRN